MLQLAGSRTRVWLAIAGSGIAFELVFQWARVWRLAPELEWGWAVLFLSAYFLWARSRDLPPLGRFEPGGRLRIAAVLGLASLPILRLLLEPFPGWPLLEWTHSLILLGLLLLFLAWVQGADRCRHLVFPLTFGLAALPWPALVQYGLMGRVRIDLASAVSELLNLCGRPAVSDGTVIRSGWGVVGIDEACGGIRSLQAGIFVALAVGEIRRDRATWRMIGVAGAVMVALVFNFLRVAFLTLVCAEGADSAWARWHTPAASIEMGLTLGVIGAGVMLPRRPVTAGRKSGPEPEVGFRALSPEVFRWGAAALAVIAVSEAATQIWYASGDHERQVASARWTARLPSDFPTYRESPLTASMQSLLQSDFHEIGQWRNGSGALREGYVFEWNRGQTGEHVLRGHNPEVCLPMSGSEAIGGERVVPVRIGSVSLPFTTRCYRRDGGIYYVYYLAWNTGENRPMPAGAATVSDHRLGWGARWEQVRARRRFVAARLIALAIYAAADAADAERSLQEEMERILRPEGS